MCKFKLVCLIFLGMVCFIEGQLSMQFVNDRLIFTWTNVNMKRNVLLHTRPKSLSEKWMSVDGDKFIVENVLKFTEVFIDVSENPYSKAYRKTYQVNKIESEEGISRNISWAIQNIIRTGLYNIYHYAENESYQEIIYIRNGEATLTDKRYLYHSGPNTSKDILFEIRNITLADAGHYKGGPFKTNDLNAGEDAVLVVYGKPEQPVIKGNNTVKVNTKTFLECKSRSTSAPEYYKKYLTLTYSWFVNKTLLRGEDSEIFSLKVTKEVKYDKYSCQAKEILHSERSEQFLLNPLYGPERVKITPQPPDEGLDVHDGETFGPYNCSAECNPPCTLQWKYKNLAGDFLNLTSAGNSSNYLPERMAIRANMTLVRCVVKGIDDKKVSDIKLNIQYLSDPKVYINGNSQNSYTMNEGNPLRVTCLVEGNPTPNVTLRKLTGDKVLGRNEFNFTLSKEAQCSDTSVYSCEVKSAEFGSKNQSFSIKVLCYPHLDESSLFKTKYGSMSGPDVILVVTVPVVANPSPSKSMITWTGPTSQLTSTEVLQRDNVIYKHWINSTIPVPDQSSFRNYSLMYDGKVIVNITINAEDKPQPPSNFSWYSYARGHINLTWVSNFNGGPEQFFILSRKEGSNWTLVENITDPGEGNMGSYHLGSLAPGQEYWYQIESCNRINCSLNPGKAIVTVQALYVSPSLFNDTIIMIGASVVAFVLVVVLTVVITMCFRKKTSVPKKGNSDERSSGSTAEVNTQSDVVVYAAVDKSLLMKNKQQVDVVKSDVKDENVESETMYSEVIKHPKKHDQTNAKKEKKNKNGEKKDMSGKEEEAGASNVKEETRTVNQDGLVYIDVEFAKKPQSSDTKGRPVIHGEEERTEYTFVDFSQKVPPKQEPEENVK